MARVRKCMGGVRRGARGKAPNRFGASGGNRRTRCARLRKVRGMSPGCATLHSSPSCRTPCCGCPRRRPSTAPPFASSKTVPGCCFARRSKTDQAGRGPRRFLGPPTVARIRSWIEAAGIDEGPPFQPMHRSGSVQPGALGERSIRRIVQARSKAAGIHGRVSGHSLRIGSAQSLAERNASLVAMQLAGRWSSPSMPACYTREQEAVRGPVACLRYGARPSGEGAPAKKSPKLGLHPHLSPR